MEITKGLLKEWDACSSGYKWFLEKFPKGGDSFDIGVALKSDSRQDDAGWLLNHIFAELIKKPELIGAYVADDVAKTLKSVDGSENSAHGQESTAASSGYSSNAASSGYYIKATSSGDYSTAASSGNYSTAASSGNYSKAASSGNSSKAASSGDYSNAASSGNSSKAASSGYSSTASAMGELTIAMVSGCGGKAKAGINGAFALAWYDKQSKSMNISVGKIGENNIKADTLYQCNEKGVLIEVAL